MARLRFWTVALLALALTGNASQSGRTQYGWSSAMSTSAASGPATSPDCSCVIYALNDRGFDADFGKWVAETIKEMVEPQSWQGSCSLRYYAPKNILVVNNSSTVHTKIDCFLKEMKTKMPKEKTGHAKSTKEQPRDLVVPAAYRQVNLPPEPSAYPVPAPVKTPKHLFHFLIRYEGEGIIDDNVVKYLKVQNQGEKQAGTKSASVPILPESLILPKITGNSKKVEKSEEKDEKEDKEKKEEEKKDEKETR